MKAIGVFLKRQRSCNMNNTFVRDRVATVAQLRPLTGFVCSSCRKSKHNCFSLNCECGKCSGGLA